MKRTDITAAAATLVTAAIIVGVLLCMHLSLPPMWPPEPHTTPLVEVDESFVDLFTPPAAGGGIVTESAPAPLSAPVSVPTPASSRPAISQVPAPAATPSASSQPRPSEARQATAAAFADAPDDDVTSDTAEKTVAGQSSAQESSSSTQGVAGTVGGGWIMPKYGKVTSYSTGSIELRATVDSSGAVTAVVLVGGKAPASGDPALVARCIAEVRRHRFTRTDTDAPPTATARITYTFR